MLLSMIKINILPKKTPPGFNSFVCRFLFCPFRSDTANTCAPLWNFSKCSTRRARLHPHTSIADGLFSFSSIPLQEKKDSKDQMRVKGDGREWQNIKHKISIETIKAHVTASLGAWGWREWIWMRILTLWFAFHTLGCCSRAHTSNSKGKYYFFWFPSTIFLRTALWKVSKSSLSKHVSNIVINATRWCVVMCEILTGVSIRAIQPLIFPSCSQSSDGGEEFELESAEMC